MKEPTHEQFEAARKEAIQEILDGFDFERVHKVMTFLNWQWIAYGVPSIERMKLVAKDLLERLDDTHPYRARGGFIAEARGSEIRLHFEIQYYEVYLEEYI